MVGAVYVHVLRTLTRAYYAALLDRLVDEFRKKRPHLKREILSHDNNTPSHTSTLHSKKIQRILQTWTPATFIDSQTSRDSYAVAQVRS